MENKNIDILISYIVAYRAFGLGKGQAQLAMQELMKLKSKDQNLNFEQIIDEQIASLPKIQDTLQLSTLMKSLLNVKS